MALVVLVLVIVIIVVVVVPAASLFDLRFPISFTPPISLSLSRSLCCLPAFNCLQFARVTRIVTKESALLINNIKKFTKNIAEM